MTEGFKFYKPCQLLQDYVRYYWIFESNQPIKTYTFPIGCPQLIFHKKSALYIPELNTKQDRLTISGQVNFSSHISAEDSVEMIVVVFHPYAMSAFLNIPISVFYNQEVSGYGLENKKLNCLATRIFDCDDNDLCISLIEQWLFSQLRTNFTTKREVDINRIAAVVHQMYSTPNTPISELASIACLSKKQFERIFFTTVGMNPKEYARIVRFQKSPYSPRKRCNWCCPSRKPSCSKPKNRQSVTIRPPSGSTTPKKPFPKKRLRRSTSWSFPTASRRR